VLEHAVKKSRHIVTISQASKQSILKHFRVRPEKISIIPNGVQPAVQPRTVSLTRLGVYEPYFLYVGNAYPHKNLEMMMHSFRQYLEHRHDAQLVIAGRRDAFSRELEQEAEEIGIPKAHLRFVDLPSDEELASLHEHASLFIFPSRLEGFGIPPLEAMSHGVPVASSSASSLPEVCGDAALYFHPDDIETLTGYMEKAVTNPTFFTPFVEKGFRRAKHFTWEQSAKKVLDLYERFFYL
jgi:glycosyltransferase involved in cell wall biosynthesis